MKRVSNISKAIMSQPVTNNPAVPSLGGLKTKVAFKEIPALNNFVKSHTISELDTRKIGIYKLKKFYKYGHKLVYFVFTYRLGRTRYTIRSCTKVKLEKTPMKSIEGYVKISKSLFRTKKFQLNELPVNIVKSINDNITSFNTEYELNLREKAVKLQKRKEKKKTNFFEGLDT